VFLLCRIFGMYKLTLQFDFDDLRDLENFCTPYRKYYIATLLSCVCYLITAYVSVLYILYGLCICSMYNVFFFNFFVSVSLICNACVLCKSCIQCMYFI
jgi:hypothetical protein